MNYPIPVGLPATPRPVAEPEDATCDGCGAAIATVTPELLHPMPDDVLGAVYGQPPGALRYIICRPLPDGYNCLYAAIVTDALHHNAHPCNAVTGLLCFCDPPDPAAHAEALRRVAARGGKLLP